MASNVPYSLQNELLNSSSEDLDNDVEVADIALRTKKLKKKGRVPRPIEPNVQVQNDQEHAGRSGEVSEDRDLGFGDIWSANKPYWISYVDCYWEMSIPNSLPWLAILSCISLEIIITSLLKFQASSSSFGASSDRRRTESAGASTLEFDSQEDVSNFKKEALFWLRHPRIKENWKTVTAAFLLFVAGIAFLLAGIILAATGQDGMKSVIFFVCAAICILPGGYHIIYIYRATKGQRGYNFESIPSFQ